MPPLALSRVDARVVESCPGGEDLVPSAWCRVRAHDTLCPPCSRKKLDSHCPCSRSSPVHGGKKREDDQGWLVEQRYWAVLEVLDGAPFSEVAIRYGMSRRSVYS
jgi:hypothetical protein